MKWPSPLLALLPLLFLLPLSSIADDEKKLYIISPADGETLSNPITVHFGLKGMGVAPAGIDFPNTGHHHLLINVNTLPAMDMPVPTDKQHMHFGGGQTQVTLELEPGEHTLQLLLGDMMHIPHSELMISDKITINVE